jgi:PPOX class probable F420-dependent enzyme
VVIDPATTQGGRALERLQKELVIWLTTGGERPQSVPVWFLWEDESLLVYSVPGKKVRQIQAHPNVHLNFNSTPTGGDVVRLEGRAEVLKGHPLASENPAYVRKYAAQIKRLGMEPESFAREYSIAIRIRPEKLFG